MRSSVISLTKKKGEEANEKLDFQQDYLWEGLGEGQARWERCLVSLCSWGQLMSSLQYRLEQELNFQFRRTGKESCFDRHLMAYAWSRRPSWRKVVGLVKKGEKRADDTPITNQKS